MTPTRRSTEDLLPMVLVMLVGALLWYVHATAWDLGGRSPILSYDSAQYALAARELMWHGQLATPFALPVDLAWHAVPPWPLSAVQPGLVLIEAFIFKFMPSYSAHVGSDPRAWLTLILPFTSFLMLGAIAVLGARHLLARYASDAPRWIKIGAPTTLGLLMVLDAEAQHFAVGGLTELPFTVLYLAAILGLARGAGAQYPLVFGLLLGVAGLFRANMLWLAPPFALLSAWCAPPGRKLRVALLVLTGFALPLAPWWIYKWRAFGSPAWDLTRFVVWDQVEGRTWFSLFHSPRVPDVPAGLDAVRLLCAKVWHNAAKLALPMLEGPRGVWLGALVAWLFTRPRRTLAAAAIMVLAGALLNTLAACASIPWLRYVFPTRVVLEAAGLFAAWNLLQRLPSSSARTRHTLCVVAGILAIAWGAWLTVLANGEAVQTARVRGTPSSSTLTLLSVKLNESLTPGETLMSNLGPALAWQTNHPVIHLAESPAAVTECRRRYDFRHVLLVFRSSKHAWDSWRELVERPGAWATVPELGAIEERRFMTVDGFTVVWLVLGPLQPQMATVAR